MYTQEYFISWLAIHKGLATRDRQLKWNLQASPPAACASLPWKMDTLFCLAVLSVPKYGLRRKNSISLHAFLVIENVNLLGLLLLSRPMLFPQLLFKLSWNEFFTVFGFQETLVLHKTSFAVNTNLFFLSF